VGTREDRTYWIVTVVVAGVVAVGAVTLAGTTPHNPRKTKPTAAKETPKPASKPKQTHFSAGAFWRRSRVFATVQGDQAFTRLGEPQPGDWLYSFRESGQTLEEYARSSPVRKTKEREILHLQPFGDLAGHQRKMLRPVREHTALFFDTRVATLPSRRVDRRWYNRRRGQYNADMIVRHLAGRVPSHSLGLFGLMGSDLYGLGLNYVFGEALLTERAGIYSLARYGEQPEALLRRSLKLSAHEIGHMFGLKHCVFYECVMNGVNSLPEMDRSPLHLCPVCLAKLKWNLKLAPVKRYRELGAFYRKVGLAPEARFVEARAAELSKE
jgi:archaemetzincin